MTRHLIILVCLALPISGHAESCAEYAKKIGVPIDTETGNVLYQEVVPIEAATTAQIYSRAKATIATTYKSAKDVIQLDDKDAGRIVAKGNFRLGDRSSVYVNHTTTVEAKDGRYRITIGDLVAEGSGLVMPFGETLNYSSCFGNRGWVDDMHKSVMGLLSALKAKMAMLSPAGGDDW